jgi:hypothetical protein
MGRWMVALYFVLVFLVGMFVAQVWDNYTDYSFTGEVVRELPSDSVPEKHILIYEDRVVLLIEGVTMSNYDSTGSMAPTLGPGVNGLRIVPSSPEEIHVGDIISFRYNGELIVHRVVEIEGEWFITKGDNSDKFERVRFEDIEYKTVALVY